MTASMADSTRIPIIKTLVESCINLAFPETPCHALCHACCVLCESMTQLISSHVHACHVLGVELAVADNLLGQVLDSLVQRRLVVSDFGADDTDSLLTHTGVGI